MSDQPNIIEPMPVQLTRMEGSINLIVERVGNLQGQLTKVETQVESLGTRVSAVELAQATSSGSSQSWKTWLPILAAFAAVGVSAVALFIQR